MARDVSMRAINVSCAVALPVARSRLSRSDCERRACTVGGWRCRHVKAARKAWTCRRPHQAIELNAQQSVAGDGDG